MNEREQRLIIVSGISGAGKTVVLNTLEDLDFYCIDNLPVSLLEELIKNFTSPTTTLSPRIAIGIDARNTDEDLSSIPSILKMLRDKNISSELLFIDADEEILTKRFSETRRKHPLSSESMTLTDALVKEREVLGVVSENADLKIDTSHMQLNDLRNIVRQRIDKRQASRLSLQFVSFGYKNGIPRDSDFVFDVRCLPNPYWKKNLRPYTGRDQPIIEFLDKQQNVTEMLKHISAFLEYWIPMFEADNRSYLSIAIGCTGGQHRSVYIASKLADRFIEKDKPVLLRHRDIL